MPDFTDPLQELAFFREVCPQLEHKVEDLQAEVRRLRMVEQEAIKMRPVVNAAITWCADHGREDEFDFPSVDDIEEQLKRNDALEAAVQAYLQVDEP